MAKARKLTEKFCEAVRIQPPKDRDEFPDTLSGVRLVVQDTGAKSWAVRYRHGRRTRKLTFGPYPQIRLADARKLAGKALVRVAEGSDPATEKAAVGADSVEANIELYMVRHVRAKLRPRSIQEVARTLARATKAWRGRSVTSVTRRDVIAYLDNVYDVSGRSAANHAHAHLSGLFNFLVDRDILSVSPVSGVRRPAVEKSRERVLSAAELRSIWRAAEQLGYPGGSFVQFLVLTACRRLEAADLPWAEIDLDARLWRLPAGRSKNGKAHEIPLSEAALAILRVCPRLGPFVFTAKGDCSFAAFSWLKRALDVSLPPDTPHWTFHDFRRSAATIMADELNVAPHVVEATLGHMRGDKIARTYNKATHANEQRVALERWANHVTELAEGRESRVIPLHTAAVR